MSDATVERSALTVTVGCKLPHGLHLDLIKDDVGKVRYTVKGTTSSQVIGGFGLTEGIPADFWEAWLEQNKALDCVKRGFVWAYGTRKNAEAKAMEMAKLRHGMEAIDPEGDARAPKNVKKKTDKDE